MNNSEKETWQDLTIPQQIQLLQMNVHRIGVTQTIKKAVKGELEIEYLLGVE